MQAFSGVKDSGAQGPARGRKVCSFMSGASRASSKEQNWPALTSKSGSEERITEDLVTGVGDKVKRKSMDFMILIRYDCYE